MQINIITRDGVDNIDTEQAPYKDMQIMNINCLNEGFETKMGKEIKIKYLREIPELRYIGGEQRSNWIDLYCAQDVRLMRGELRAIPLGVAMQLPEGYEATMAPRSSTFKNYKILMVNSIGIIDESYCGDADEWLFPAYATEDTFIPARTRIAQFRIIKHQPTIRFTATDALGNTGRGGYGSTGKGVPSV